MIEKIRRKFKSEDNKRLLSNFTSLAILNGFNYFLPLITLPYLVRVLGVQYFGLLSLATAVISYFNIVTDYGFNLTATRDISIHREDKEKIIEIFSSVMIVKSILMLISFIVLCIIVMSFDKFSKNWEIYFLTFGTVLGRLLFPVWFYQGMEKMKYITYLDILAKSIFTASVFIFVQKQSDFYVVPVLSSLGFFVSGVCSLVIIRREFGVNFKWQSFTKIKYYAKESYYIFISNISVTLYTSTTIVLLGVFTNETMVGYYSMADKLIAAMKQLITPVSQAFFPYISKKAKASKRITLNIVKKLAIITIPLSAILTFFLFIMAEEVLKFIFGIVGPTAIILRILAIIPLLVVLDTIFGTLLMLVFKRDKEYGKIIISAGIINLILAVIFIPLFQCVGAAFSVLIVELYITFRLISYTVNNGLKIM